MDDLHVRTPGVWGPAEGGVVGGVWAPAGERQQRKWQAERQSKRGAKPCPHWVYSLLGVRRLSELNEGRCAPSVFEQTDTMRMGAAVALRDFDP